MVFWVTDAIIVIVFLSCAFLEETSLIVLWSLGITIYLNYLKAFKVFLVTLLSYVQCNFYILKKNSSVELNLHNCMHTAAE